MEWTDEGLVIGFRRHGEGNAIVELMTRERGRHLGLVRGGGARRQASVLQPGNRVRAIWRARLEAQLGHFLLEPVSERAGRLMRLPHGAYGLSYLSALLHLLPERDPHPGLFMVCDAILDAFDAPDNAGQLLARFELMVLKDLGFGLELERCAATGGANDLIFVSPRTGRAVSAAAGAPYSERLFALPTFLLGAVLPPSGADVDDALLLTGYFLSRRIFEPRGLALPDTRHGFLMALRRAREAGMHSDRF